MANIYYLSRIIALMNPILAVVVLFLVPVFAFPLALLVPERFSEGVLSAICMLFYVGWPYLTIVYLSKEVELPLEPRHKLLVFCVIYFILFSLFLLEVHRFLMIESAATRILEGFVILLWGWCALFVMWSAARTLTSAEDGRVVAANRAFGTFVLFLLLPFAVWAIQQRLRRIGQRSPADAAVDDC